MLLYSLYRTIIVLFFTGTNDYADISSVYASSQSPTLSAPSIAVKFLPKGALVEVEVVAEVG